MQREATVKFERHWVCNLANQTGYEGDVCSEAQPHALDYWRCGWYWLTEPLTDAEMQQKSAGTGLVVKVSGPDLSVLWWELADEEKVKALSVRIEDGHLQYQVNGGEWSKPVGRPKGQDI